MAEEEGRRKVERDLHDGVQQQLIVLLARSELLRAQLPPGSAAAELATQTRDLARSTLVDLRSLVDGIHPPVLTDRGLIAAVEARVGQLPIDVALDVHAGLHGARFPAEVEGAAYFVACESLTNVMKHSGSRQARVTISGEPGGQLRVTVSDGGCGDARLGIGTGLAGLRDRVEALGGVLDVRSEVGAGTTVSACLPCAVTANA
jgi:signal transduction histidine kinase